MNEIFERRSNKRKQLEKDLPILQKMVDNIRDNQISLKELQNCLGLSFNNIREILERNSITISYNNETVNFRRNYDRKVEELENEYRYLVKESKSDSFMEKYGREIIIGVLTNLVSFILGFYLGNIL